MATTHETSYFTRNNLPFTPDSKPWDHLPRYAAFKTSHVLHVREDGARPELSAAHYCEPFTNMQGLNRGLHISVGWHVGRSSYFVTLYDGVSNDHQRRWFSDFQEALWAAKDLLFDHRAKHNKFPNNNPKCRTWHHRGDCCLTCGNDERTP